MEGREPADLAWNQPLTTASSVRPYSYDEFVVEVAGLFSEIARLGAVSLAGLSGGQVVELQREVTRAVRQLAGVQLAVVAELDQRGTAGEFNCSSTAALLTHVSRVDPGEATGLVRAARRLGPRRALGGERLEPEFPVLAAAVGAGTVSLAHARVITAAIEKLPDAAVDAAGGQPWCEAFLTEQAAQFDPRTLRLVARRLGDRFDPDGTLADERYRDRHRGLSIFQRADGSARIEGELTAVCSEALLTCLDPLARPHPAEDGAPDPRSPAQRRHDGLQDALLTALRTGALPDCGGITTTILVTMTKEQAETAAGLALTGHGALIPVPLALSLAGDAQLHVVVTSKVGAIEGYSGTHRLFTPAQRLAMAARDGGCSVPGCTTPPAWCQAAHITGHATGGPTLVDNGTLLCGDHHRRLDTTGDWHCTMINGIPHWIPPPWIDPTQTPRRNHAHAPPGAMK